MKTSYQKTHKKLPTFCAGKPKNMTQKNLQREDLLRLYSRDLCLFPGIHIQTPRPH